MQPPVLPLELYRDIFQHLNGHLSTLRSLAFVSKACNAEATPVLYHTLDSHNQTTQRLFLQSLLIDPDRAKWVKKWKFRTCERVGIRSESIGLGIGRGANQQPRVAKLSTQPYGLGGTGCISGNCDTGDNADIIYLLHNVLPSMCNLSELSVRLGQNISEEGDMPQAQTSRSANIIYPPSPGTHLAAVLPRCSFQLRVFEWDVPSADPHNDELSLLAFLVQRWQLHHQLERLRIIWGDTVADGWSTLPGIARSTQHPNSTTAAPTVIDMEPTHEDLPRSSQVAFPALKVFAGNLKSIIAFLPLLRARHVQTILWVASDPEDLVIQRHESSSLVPFIQSSHANDAWDVTRLYTSRRSNTVVHMRDPPTFWEFFRQNLDPLSLRDIISATTPLLSLIQSTTHLSLDGIDQRLKLGMLASALIQLKVLELIGYCEEELDHIKSLRGLTTILFSLPSFSSSQAYFSANSPLPPRSAKEQSDLVKKLFQENSALETVNIQIKFTVSPTGWFKQWKRFDHELGNWDEPVIVDKEELGWWY